MKNMKKNIVNFYSLLIGTAVGAFGTRKIISKKVEQNQKLSDKHLSLFLMMNQWVKVKQEGKNISLFFEKNGYREIAIYGMSYVGKTLMNELADTTIKVKYGIDQNTNIINERVAIVLPEDMLEPVDAIVVTSIAFFTKIEDYLSKKIDCPIISLEDILYEI